MFCIVDLVGGGILDAVDASRVVMKVELNNLVNISLCLLRHTYKCLRSMMEHIDGKRSSFVSDPPGEDEFTVALVNQTRAYLMRTS